MNGELRRTESVVCYPGPISLEKPKRKVRAKYLKRCGDPGWIRTSDPQLRSQLVGVTIRQ